MSKRRPAPDAPAVNQSEEDEYDSPILLLTRMYWVGFGPIFAMLSLTFVAANSTGWLTLIDAVYLFFVALLPLSRWIEFRLGKAATTAGKPATSMDLRNYSLGVAVVGVLAWIVAKLINYFLIAG